MNTWIVGKDLMKPHLQIKKNFYSELYLEDVTDEDYIHCSKSTFIIKKPSEYHDLYVQSDTSLLADVFENFTNKWIEIQELDPVYFLSVPGLAWQACLKKTEIRIINR